jgi:hypothetical protein
MNKITKYEFAIKEAEDKLKAFIEEDESGDIEVKITDKLPKIDDVEFMPEDTCTSNL